MTALAPPENAFWADNRLSVPFADMTSDVALECVRSAQREVDRMAPLMAKNIEHDVQSLICLCRQGEAEIFGQCREIGWLALRVLESARMAHQTALADAAGGLWEMTQALSERGVWHTEALVLHIDALQALTSTSPIDAESMAAMERALLAMRTAIGAPAAH